MEAMSLINSTAALSSQSHTFSVLQGAGTLNERNVTRLGKSKLVRDSKGSIHHIGKTPAELLGEKVLRPIIDKISSLASYVSSFTQYLPSFPSLPVAHAKERPSTTATMHFPSREVLVSCLDNHPLTGKQVTKYLTEKGITQAVAESFADTDKAPMGVDLGVMLTVYDLNEKLRLPDPTLTILQMSLVGALRDCAIENKLPEERATNYNHMSDL